MTLTGSVKTHPDGSSAYASGSVSAYTSAQHEQEAGPFSGGVLEDYRESTVAAPHPNEFTKNPGPISNDVFDDPAYGSHEFSVETTFGLAGYVDAYADFPSSSTATVDATNTITISAENFQLMGEGM